jgi:C4-dicarboxylate-specific signal transduction histidine kinase
MSDIIVSLVVSFKRILDSVVASIITNSLYDEQKQQVQMAIHNAFKEWIIAILQILQAQEYENSELRQFFDDYKQAIEIFLSDPKVAEELLKPFSVTTTKYKIDSNLLMRRWRSLELRDLPEEFDAASVCRAYLRRVQKAGIVTSELRELFLAQLSQNQTNYLESIREQIEKQQAELLRSRQMVTIAKMASSLAHEIMQPLQIILMKADNCLWEIEHDQIEKYGIIKDLKNIIETTIRIDHIVKRLRILSQEHKLKLELVDINTVIENAFLGFGEQFKSRHIFSEKNLTNNVPLIKADKIQLEQVVTILISNARDALEGCDNKRITISTQLHNNQVIFQLTDNGVGIASDKLANIFDAFMTTKEKTSMGLGLHIAKDIIQAYNGKITVDSDINKGTIFSVSFPIAKEE